MRTYQYRTIAGIIEVIYDFDVDGCEEGFSIENVEVRVDINDIEVDVELPLERKGYNGKTALEEICELLRDNVCDWYCNELDD